MGGQFSTKMFSWGFHSKDIFFAESSHVPGKVWNVCPPTKPPPSASEKERLWSKDFVGRLHKKWKVSTENVDETVGGKIISIKIFQGKTNSISQPLKSNFSGSVQLHGPRGWKLVIVIFIICIRTLGQFFHYMCG